MIARDQPRRADAVGAAMDGMHPCRRARSPWRLIGFEYLSPKWKMWPTSMPRAETRSASAIFADLRGLVHLVGRRVGRRPLVDDAAILRRRRNSMLCARHGQARGNRVWQNTWLSPVSARMMNSWLRSPPIGPVSARIGIACQAHAREGAQIGDEHPVVGVPRALESRSKE